MILNMKITFTQKIKKSLTNNSNKGFKISKDNAIYVACTVFL